MKKQILIAVSLLTTSFSYAQMTLEHTYPADKAQIILLSNAGRKIAVDDLDNNQIKLYNLNHTLWKTIPVPQIGSFSAWHYNYTSDNLFNSDNLVEAAIYYQGTTNLYLYKMLIVNENGQTLQTIDSVSNMLVQTSGTNQFHAMAYNSSFTKVFALPGTIPCEPCSGSLGIAKPENTGNKPVISDAVPNPSSNEVKIFYSLPANVREAELNIFNNEGKKVKSFRVGSAFEYITIDNSELPSGVYYYNLTSNNNVTTSKKMLVIK